MGFVYRKKFGWTGVAVVKSKQKRVENEGSYGEVGLGRMESENFWEARRVSILPADVLWRQQIFYNACAYFITTADTLSRELTILCLILC